MIRVVLLASLLLTACVEPAPRTDDPPATTALPEHHKRWPGRVGQGGQPRDYQALADAGYRTVISVDGVLPDAKAAAAAGLRVVHLPIGYDGVDVAQAVRIVRAAQLSEGPVYVHCHYGLHRGPAAAMLVRIALEGLDPKQAVADLRASGASEHYAGLYRDVGAFAPPSAEALAAVDPASLTDGVTPSDLVGAMLGVDAIYGRLAACQDAGWQAPSTQPDLAPAHEALILREAFRELARTPDARARGKTFLALAAKAEAASQTLEASLRSATADSSAALQDVARSCTQCHERFRD